MSKTVETTTKMEQILLKEFPEVDKVVSRIGAAEVPTDPMSMEEIDMIIKLKPRKTWTSANTKEELAERFKEALSVLPGIEYEFTQPIEMRFNELITGVRADIAIKIFGDDLTYIDQKAIEIKALIEGIPGAEDIILEKTAGLPQIRVTYLRDKVAFYGVPIKTLNSYLSTAFGGQATGVVFEGEKRFDLVVRLDQQHRTDIEDIRRLKVPLPGEQQVPLAEMATIDYAEGPAKISRENAHRRVVVSVNVRNRDLQSVVHDIRTVVDREVTLKPGTYIDYGGQFKNLQNASNRLLFAVPVALLLIFIFLHFAFKSLKDAVMIFSAIPLATVGGVVLLWLRGMPFSVSAGVGFIALFGIAVLNGIVLIEHLKTLKVNGNMCLHELIIQGTKDRLRPVMLTAGAAAMGFLPMALSTGAGAEVQRPLATVVIGGLFTSTLLTMIALPLLFEVFYNVVDIKFFPLRFIRSSRCGVILLLLLPFSSVIAQGQSTSTQPTPRYATNDLTTGNQPSSSRMISLDEAVATALRHNKELAAYSLRTDEQKALVRAAVDVDKTLFTYGSDQNNIAENNAPLHVWGVEQQVSFPSVYTAAVSSKQRALALAEAEVAIHRDALRKKVSAAYVELQVMGERKRMFQQLDSLYTHLLEGASRQRELGAISQLDWLTMEAKRQQSRQRLQEAHSKLDAAQAGFKTLLGSDSAFTVSPTLTVLTTVGRGIEASPYVDWLRRREDLDEASLSLERRKLLPDFTFNYFLGTNFQANAKYYHGFEAGVALPLFFGAQQAKIKASKLALASTQQLSAYEFDQLKTKHQELVNARQLYKERMAYFNDKGRQLHDELLRTATLSLQAGDIDVQHFTLSLETALQLKLDYLANVLDYTHATLELTYLTQ